MKNVSKIVALILSASAGVWMTGCAAEMGDPSEDTDIASDAVQHGGITKGGFTKGAPISKGKGMIGQDSQVGGSLGLGGQFEGSMAGKGARGTAGGSQVDQPLGGQLGGQVGGQLGGQLGGGQEKIEDTQRAGGGGQLGDQDLGQDTEDQDLAVQDEADQEGDTASSQEALSSWGWGGGYGYRPWYGGYGYGWRGYGLYPGRRFFYGAYPYYGGCGATPYVGYAGYGGCYW